jgi:precorrin-6B methylase 2
MSWLTSQICTDDNLLPDTHIAMRLAKLLAHHFDDLVTAVVTADSYHAQISEFEHADVLFNLTHIQWAEHTVTGSQQALSVDRPYLDSSFGHREM